MLEVPAPVPGRPGRRAKHLRLAAGQPGRGPVSAVVAALPPTAWTRLAVSQGEKGPIEYDWALVSVVESHRRLPGPDARLLVRRSCSDPTERAYYLSNAPQQYALETLARVAAQRFTVEQCIQEAKDDTGMDQYEVRSWQSWHRHMTLTLMALAWLGSVRRRAEGSKRGVPRLGAPDHHGSPPPAGDHLAVAALLQSLAPGVVPVAPSAASASPSEPLPTKSPL